MLVTSIFKFSNSTYLSGAFQLKDDCFRAGQPCLCLCTSLRLAVFETDKGPVSASLITIIAAVAAWIAFWGDYLTGYPLCPTFPLEFVFCPVFLLLME